MSTTPKPTKRERSPLIVIEWIIAIFTTIGAVYTLSPMLDFSIAQNGPTPFVSVVGSDLGITIFGIVFLISALILVYGIVRRKQGWRSLGLFLNGLTRLYIIIATFLATGPFPFTWLSNAAVMVMAFYIWGRLRKRGLE